MYADEAFDPTPDGTSANATRLQLLASLTAELAATDSISEVVEIVVTRVAEVVAASVSVLMLRADDDLVIAGSRGLREDGANTWARFPIDRTTPAGRAAVEGRPVVVEGRRSVEADYPTLRGQLPVDRTVVCLPMTVQRTTIGVIALTFDRPWQPHQYEMDFLATFADCTAQVVRRIQATAAERLRAERLRFLAQASQSLNSSLDYRSTLQRVAQLAVPGLADWCSVALVEHGQLRTLAVAHVEPEKAAWAWELQEKYAPEPDGPTGAPNVVRTGQSELYREITDDMLQASARDEEHLRLARALNLRSAIIAPLKARGETIGAITLIRAETPGSYNEEDLEFAEHLARRAGLAIDNAMLYTQARDVALQLQRAVLPERLTDIPGWEVATHYEPGDKAEVGGDFYDAVALDGNRIAVVIGDVMGHGVEAAAAMAMIRAAARAYLSVDPDPCLVMRKLDVMFAKLRVTRLVTLVYAVIDADAGELSFVSAGHHGPLLVPVDGDPQYVPTPPARPLGAGGDVRLAQTVPYRRGDVLMLFTDGVVERRDELIDDGLARLAASADVLKATHLDAALANLVAGFGQSSDDDVTAIAVRQRATEGETIVDDSAAKFGVESERADDLVTLRVRGEIDLATVPQLRAAVEDVISSGSAVALDLSGVTFLDSTGLGCFVELHQRAQDAGVGIQFVDVAPGAARTIAIGGLASLLGTESDQAG